MVVVKCRVNNYLRSDGTILTISPGYVLSTFELLIFEGHMYNLSWRGYNGYDKSLDELIFQGCTPTICFNGDTYHIRDNIKRLLRLNLMGDSIALSVSIGYMEINTTDLKCVFLNRKRYMRMLLTIQRWTRKILWTLREKYRVAVMMAFHSRLGAQSGLSALPVDLMQKIYM
jgi:hypothetical protein